MNLKKAVAVMSLCAIIAGCNVEPPKKAEKKPQLRTYAVLEVMTPSNASVSQYLDNEYVEGRISYKGMSQIFRELNVNKAAFHSGHKDDIVYFHPNKKVRAPDFNGDGKIFGKKGNNVGIYEVYR